MAENETPEKLANEIPEDISDLIKSEDTVLKIAEICFDNGIEEDEKIREISYQTGRVLLGDLSPAEFQKILEEKAKETTFLAGKIAREINDLIFYPVRESLATIYKTEIASPEKPPTGPSEEKPEGPKKADVYREPVE